MARFYRQKRIFWLSLIVIDYTDLMRRDRRQPRNTTLMSADRFAR
jgi:hypothetical protein